MNALFLEGRDLAAVTSIDDVDLRVAVDFAHEPHAARAENAPLTIEHERRAEVDVALDAFAVEYAAGKIRSALSGPEVIGEILQRTFAALVADWAVERVVHEQEFEHAGARLNHIRSVGRDDHAFGADRRARRLQLRHLLDLHDAHAARAVDADARVITVIGNFDAVLDGCLKNGLALLDSDLTAVYRQRDGVHEL